MGMTFCSTKLPAVSFSTRLQWPPAAVLGGPSLVGSSSASTLYWPSGQALPAFAQPTHLDVANIARLSGDQQALLVTLQGV
jgi:hypothetical protein